MGALFGQGSFPEVASINKGQIVAKILSIRKFLLQRNVTECGTLKNLFRYFGHFFFRALSKITVTIFFLRFVINIPFTSIYDFCLNNSMKIYLGGKKTNLYVHRGEYIAVWTWTKTDPKASSCQNGFLAKVAPMLKSTTDKI